MIDPADYRLSVEGAVEVCHRETAEMLHREHEQALDERNEALWALEETRWTAAQLERIEGFVAEYAPWAMGCRTPAGRVHAICLRLSRLERSVVK